MRDQVLDPTSSRRPRSPAAPEDATSSRIDPIELARWLDEHRGRLHGRWLGGVERRAGGLSAEVRSLLGDFLEVLVDFLPAFLGPYREQVRPLWGQAAELYGSLAAMRGLAAGEVIEEFQLLREEMLRLFYDEPPVRDLDRLALRDVLRVNRVVDDGVTHASVGHTDALFFALFQGSGVPETLSGEQAVEVREQLGTIRSEFRDLMELLEE